MEKPTHNPNHFINNNIDQSLKADVVLISNESGHS